MESAHANKKSISELKKAKANLEVELQEKTLRLKEYNESIVASIPSSILVVDKNLRIVSANQSFYEDFELEEKEVKSKRLRPTR